MAFTQNFNSDTFGPIQWKLMGPIADRPATADLHTTYLSTDEGNGVLKAYLYTESGWMQMQGIEGFTGGGGGSSGVLVVNEDSDTNTLDKTWQEIADADFAVVKSEDAVGMLTAAVQCVGFDDTNKYFVESVLSGGLVKYSCNTADGYPVYVEG